MRGARGVMKEFAKGKRRMPGPGENAFYLISSLLRGED
jgi:hypothetical protein